MAAATAVLALAVGAAAYAGASGSNGSSGSDGSDDTRRAVVADGPSADTGTRALLGRSRPVSRDSARQALADATGLTADPPTSGQARQRDTGLAELAAKAEQEAASLTEGWVLPLASGYRVSAGFGECSALWARCHTGLDLAAPSGTPIRAVAAGTITEVGWAGAYGNRTVQTLEDGTELWYCHQEAIGVQVGDQVTAGQEIGSVGSTGNSTGPHLHLEVRPGAGDPVDPLAALAARGVTP